MSRHPWVFKESLDMALSALLWLTVLGHTLGSMLSEVCSAWLIL